MQQAADPCPLSTQMLYLSMIAGAAGAAGQLYAAALCMHLRPGATLSRSPHPHPKLQYWPCLQQQHVTRRASAQTPEHAAEHSLIPVLQEQQTKRQRSAHISDHHRMTSALDKCPFCFGSAARARHLTISLGQCSYLALPARCSVRKKTSGFALLMLTLATALGQCIYQALPTIGLLFRAWELCAGHHWNALHSTASQPAGAWTWACRHSRALSEHCSQESTV